MNNPLKIFFDIAKLLNEKLNIIPVLFGGVGVNFAIKSSFPTEDIDVLIPDSFLDKNWCQLKKCLLNNGWKLIDLHEHEFIKNDNKIAFGTMSGLKVNIKKRDLILENQGNIQFYALTPKQYLEVYTKFSKEKFRLSQKNKIQKDLYKIKLIKEYLNS